MERKICKKIKSENKRLALFRKKRYYDLDARQELTNKLFLTAQFRMISQKLFCCLSIFMRKTAVHDVLVDASFP